MMHLLTVLLLLSLGLSVVSLGAVKLSRARWNLMQPYALACLVIGVVYFLIPAWQLSSGTLRFQEQYSLQAWLSASCFNFAYFLALSAAVYGIGGRGVLPRRLPRSLDSASYFSTVLIIGVPFTIGVLALGEMIGDVGIASYMSNRIVLLRGKGYISSYIYLSYALIGILGVNAAVRKLRKNQTRRGRRIDALFFWVIAGLSVFAYLMLGSRQTLIFPLVLLILLWSSVKEVSGRSLAKYIAVGSLTLIVLLYLGYIRVRLADLDEHLATSTAGAVISAGLADALGNNENLVWLLDNRGKWDLLGGATMLAAVTNVVPRAFWPEKPFGGGPALKNLISPGSYNLLDENVSSYTTGLPVEALMNFGIVGSLIVGIFHGVLLAFLQRAWRFFSKDVILIVLYGNLTLTLSYMLLTNEFLGATSRILVISFALLLCKGVAHGFSSLRASHARS